MQNVNNPLYTFSDGTEHRFSQKELDPETGNDYFLARYYSPEFGRFLSPDWSAKVSPIPYASLAEPQSLNLYAYVLNSPLVHVDPDGHDGTGCKGFECLMQANWVAEHQIGNWMQTGLALLGQYVAGSAQQQSDKNTSVMLYAGAPPTPSQPGVNSVMDYQIVPSANTAKELHQKMNPWSHADVVALNDLQKLGTRIWESIGGGPWGWQKNDFLTGGGHDNLSIFDGHVEQKWYIGPDPGSMKRVQVVVGVESNGRLIKAWTVGITFNSSGPVFRKIE